MNYKILTIAPFDKQLKRLIKKYPSLKTEISHLAKELLIEPNKGIPIGNDCYKIRLAISSKGRGKSAGARVITYVVVTEYSIFLLSIYDKSDQANIDDKELIRLLELTK
ncbi:MAG: type II toxin-antitoxin system RelE/ParE family toxin [Bacteroidota bacterium]